MNWFFIYSPLAFLNLSLAQDAGYDRKALQSLTEYRQRHRKTTDGRLCAAAFVQDDKTYTDCTTARSPEGVSGREWCYVEVQLLGKGARDWDYCQGVVDYEAVRVAFRYWLHSTNLKAEVDGSQHSDLAKRKMADLTQMTAFFQEQNQRLQFALRKYEQLCVASSASEERMHLVDDLLEGSKRAIEELQSNISKVHALDAVAAHVTEEVERDADATLANPFNCAAGYRDEEAIDLRVEGFPVFPGLPPESFSVRWDGYLVPTVSDRYRLFTFADCGLRVFLDDSPVIVDRMQMPDEGAAFSEEAIQPLHPSGFTGTAKIFSGPQDLHAGHRHRLRVEFFHLASHKFKNPESARAALGWTSSTIPEQIIPKANYYQSNSPPLLKIAGLPGDSFDLSTLEDGQLAFTDSSSHFLADIPAFYRGLRLLRTRMSPEDTTVHFEASADCLLFVAVPRDKSPPSPSRRLAFQPLKFKSVDNGISVYTAASREVVATEEQIFSLFSVPVLPGLVAFDLPPDTSFFAFFEPVRKSEHSCQGAATVVSLTRAASYEGCSQSSAVSPQYDCSAGLSGMNVDLPFGSWRTVPGRTINEYLMVSFKVPVELSELQFKTLEDPSTWPTEISLEFPGSQESTKFPVRPGDHTYHFRARVVRGATVRITGKKTLDTSAGTGGSMAFIGIPCEQLRKKQKVQKKKEEEAQPEETVSISFGEMTSGFVPAGFKQDDGSPKTQRGAFAFGWEHSAPLSHPDDCKETSALRAGVSFPEPHCSHADSCSPLVDCNYPNSWSIDMPSLGAYFVTVEAGSPCGDVRLTNLLVNDVPFISNELLHAGQYTKAVGRVRLVSSPTIKLTANTRVTLQAVVIQKIRPKQTKGAADHQPQHQGASLPEASVIPNK